LGSYWVEIGFYERFLRIYGEKHGPKLEETGEFRRVLVQFFQKPARFGTKAESWSRKLAVFLG
jgi:hypothetical protein